jgi:transcriptional regulator with PAS, ATPase and Fis domain
VIKLVTGSTERPIAFPLPEVPDELIAGALPENAIYLPYKGISRQHFSLRLKNGEWYIRDLDSTNGTLLNGKKITESKIRPKDTIQAGTVLIHVEASEHEFRPIESVSTGTSPEDRKKTEKTGSIPLEGYQPIYSFKRLVIPDQMVMCKSAAMVDIYRKIDSICDSDANVLLVGETGTGKEMMAKMLHLSSKRAPEPFVAINCAAIPADLAESELFGIGERVATNVNQRKGKMALADKGTLFLDELSAFPYDLQAKILRAVEEKAVTPLGENRPLNVNFRVVSATNLSPDELIQTHKLREDLYHRLGTVEIQIPPLRERPEDLEVIIPSLLHHIAQNENKRFPGISSRLLSLLLHYSFPGNIRELINILRSMVVLAHPGELLDIHLIPEKIIQSKESSGSFFSENALGKEPFDLRETLHDISRKMILYALNLHDGNIKKAAAHLKISTFGLRKMMKRLDIKK